MSSFQQRWRGAASTSAWVLLTALAGCSYLRRTPPESLTAIVAQGGTEQLRKPMRPIRGGTRVLVFAFDGVSDETLREAIAGGRVPRIAGLLGPEGSTPGIFRNGYAAADVLSVLPSSTTASWISVFTGRTPAQTGIAGNEWWVREEGRFYAPTPMSVPDQTHALESFTQGLVGKQLRTPTLYEQVDVRTHVSFSEVHRGADLLTMPDFGEVGDLLGGVLQGILKGRSARRQAFRELDRESVETVLNAIRDHGLPDLQVVYFPGVDLMAHVTPEPVASMQRYLAEVLDPTIGEVLDAYREQGALERTYVLFVSDHGHTPVLADDRHALGTDGASEPPALLEQIGYRVRAFRLNADRQDFQAVFAYQGFMAYLYLADRSTCAREGDACDWSRPPRMEQDVMPVVRAFDRANRTGKGVPELRGTLDLILAREPTSHSRPATAFRVYDGSRLVPIGEYLRRNPRPELLDLERRLTGLAVGPYGHRAGDVLLIARAGTERPIGERFYFGEENHSTHGSAHASDSRIPLIVARPGQSGVAIRALVRRAVGGTPSQLEVTPLVRALLGER